MTQLIVAVHGATGTQGTRIARRLRAAGHHVRPLSSASADLTDTAALLRAYDGADAVVVHLPQVFDPLAVAQAESVLAALGKAGVPRAVFNPGMPLPPGPVGAPFVDARVLLGDRLPERVEHSWVIGPAGPYLENLLQPWSVRRVLRHGELAYPLPPQAPVPWGTLDDVGDVIAETLAQAPPSARLIVSGPEAVTGDRLAAAVAAAAGRPVRYAQVGPAEYGRLIEPVVGAAAAAGIAAVYERDAAAPSPPPPPGLLRPGATTVEEWAAQADWTA
ncbi:NmrA family NAD(P)-binding protein [Planomonospora alba]|uniref:NmrA family NAD(P)-binding protein n=1 Tax=Planomonospora alba TaxID=161354 RepID=A0ABP6NAR9_9ACTN